MEEREVVQRKLKMKNGEDEVGEKLKEVSLAGHDDEEGQVDECNADSDGLSCLPEDKSKLSAKGGGQLILFQSHTPALMRQLELDYNLYMAEAVQLTASPQKCLDITLETSSCFRCDPRLKPMLTTPIQANIQLKEHIQFVPPNPFHKGYFCYSRMWNGKHKFLPSGEKEAKIRTQKLLNKLNKKGDAVPREATYRLQNLFAEKGITWATNFDLSQKNTYLGLLGVLKHGSSTSVRFCVSPNHKFQTEIGLLSFNNCIRALTVNQPRMYRFQIEKMFSSLTTLSDITQQFPSIHFDYSTSLHCLYFCYKDKLGWPTFVQTDSSDGVLHAVKGGRLIFGHCDAPAVAQYTMLEASEVFLQHNKNLSPEQKCLVSMIRTILTHSRFADDIQLSCTPERVHEYCKVVGIKLPRPPPVSKICIEEGVCTGKHEIFTGAMFDCYKKEFKKISKELMIKLCASLVEILNFSGFSLKYLHGENELQDKLDEMVENQPCNQERLEVKVKRPSSKEVSEHISRLGGFQHENEFERPEIEIGEKSAIEHLGYVYGKNEIELKIKSMALIYYDGKHNKRSPELFSYQQFENFVKEYHPQFTRRSLFSCVARNGDNSGKFLCLFRSQLKIAIRLFLKKYPEAKWETRLDTETLTRLKAAIKSYFFLVQQKLPQTNVFKYNSHQLYLCGTCDGSESLFCVSTTLVARHCLGGVVASTAEHLTLHPFSVNVHIVSMVDVELLGILRLCTEMSCVLDELERLGVQIPGENRYIYTDSKIVLTLARQNIQYMRKKYAFGISKLQLKLFDMRMNPYSSVAYVCQKQGTLFADYYSKITSFTLENTVRKFKKIHDLKWIESAHPRRLPGVCFETALPSGAEMRYMEENTIIQGEMSAFELDLKTKKVQNTEHILTAAANFVQINSNDESCAGCCFKEDSSESEYKSLCLGEINSIKTNEKEVKRSESKRKSDKSEVKSQINITDVDKDIDNQKKKTDKKTDEDNLISRQATISVTDSWRRQIDLLLQRKRCYGLGARSALSILKLCLKFIRRCKEDMRKDSMKRKERQCERQEQREQMSETLRQNTKSEQLKDLHDRPVRSMDLINCNLGQFDDLIQIPGARNTSSWEKEEENEEGEKEKDEKEKRKKEEKVEVKSESEADDFDQRRVFHHLATIYQSISTVRGFERKYYENKHGGRIGLLEGRRHRGYLERKLRRSRLRSLNSKSEFESTLLMAAHASCKGQNLPKAELSLLNVHIYIESMREKLQELQKNCPACRRRRALAQGERDKVRKQELGPSDYMARSIRWMEGKQTAILDVVGPLASFGTFEGSSVTKMFAVVIVELPLKTCHILPLRSYASEHFLLAMRTYVNLRMCPMDIWIGDAASNFKRLQNTSAGFVSQEDEDHQGEKLKLYRDLETGDGKQRLKEAGLFVRVSSGDHAVVGSCEVVVATVKQCLRSYGKSMHTALTFFEWENVFSQVSLCIASRPIHSSKEGKLFTAMGILNLMGRTGVHWGDDNLDVKLDGADKVSERLSKMEENMLQMKKQVAEILLHLMIEPAFLNNQVRKENIKIRDVAEDQELNSVYFCPRIFARCCNFTGSLLRLCRIGLSRQTGLFQKSGRLKAGSFVTRNLGDLYLIAEAGKDQSIGNQDWLPTWNLKKALELGSIQRGYVRWEKANEAEQLVHCEMDKEAGELVPKKMQAGGGEEKEENRLEEDKKEEEDEKRVEEEKEEEDKKEENKTIKQRFTRGGRQVKAPERYQAGL